MADHPPVDQRTLAALGGVVAGLAHELNTPLGAGRTAAELLTSELHQLSRQLDQGPVSEARLRASLGVLHETTSLVQRSLDRLTTLVTAARHATPDDWNPAPRPTDFAPWAARLQAGLTELIARQGASLDFEVPPLDCLDVAAGALWQVVSNLVCHAGRRGFSPDVPHPRVRVRFGITDTHLTVEVTDNARRLDPAVWDRVFEPFAAMLGTGNGSGLDLHIAWSVVTAVFSGELSFGVVPDGGHRFDVRLPFGSAGLPAPPTVAPPIHIPLRTEFPAELWVAYRDDLDLLAHDLFAETNPEALRRLCHKLGGSAGLYGVVPLREAALALQHTPDPVHDRPLRSHLQAVIDATRKAVDALT